MKKKILAVLLTTVMLTSCGGDTSSETADTGSDTNTDTAEQGDTSSESADTSTEEPSVTLKLAFSTNEEDPRAKASEQFKAEVEEKTNGSVTVEIYPSGQLGGDAALIEAMALDSGTVDIIITDASNFATYEPKMGISALPFQFSTFEDAWDFMDSDIEAKAEELLLDYNMRVLAHYDNGFRCVTTSDVAVESPDDMANLLIRTPENPVIMATMEALGANPQPLAFSELYMALQQGTYDAQENPVPVIYNNNLYEVQNYLSVTNHIYSGMCFTIADSTWGKMSENQQAIVTEAALASQDFNRELNKTQTEELLSELEATGMTIVNPDLAPFAEATSGVAEDLRDTYGELLDELETWKEGR
ncbi:MAG: TRAP transporter substrate-binding protein [Lachnospirales bacterium]